MKRHLSLIFLFLLILVCVFFIGRLSNKTRGSIQSVDTSSFERKNDSLLKLIDKIHDSVRVAYIKIDSLSEKRKVNNKKTKENVDKIKKFTPTTRSLWNDSVLRANGLK